MRSGFLRDLCGYFLAIFAIQAFSRLTKGTMTAKDAKNIRKVR
jgi:hypothetical protein